jgi:glycerol-3-phosphate dehydrogenase
MKPRSQVLNNLDNSEFDLVIVGGGVVGAGVAQDAASRGLSVLVIEKSDFASGTSSRTTKLIHGGLRYLEQFQFRLTRELCQERGLLEQLAPHMVRDFSFILPVNKDNSFFGLKAEVGLSLYDLLSINARGVRRHKRMSPRQIQESAPWLNAKNLAFGLRFHDCITDDSRVVMEVLKSAAAHGAQAINYMEAEGFDIVDGYVRAVNCRDRINGNSYKIKCRSCINAAGVWSDKLLQGVDPQWKNKLQPAKGTHIMVPLSSFETKTALFLPTKDGRYVFVVPWQKALMIGTTDIAYDGPLDNPQASEEEILYLLEVLNSFISPTARKVERADVIAAWAGLRPLVAAESDENTSNLSREHLLFEGPGGMIGLIGGKLTNYRLLAIHLVDMAMEKMKKTSGQTYSHIHASKTGTMMLGGFDNKEDFLATTALIATRARKLGLEPASIEHLTATYGKDSLKILDTLETTPTLIERICPDFPPIMAEIPFLLEEEMAISLEDILSRRIRLGFLHQRQCLEAAVKVGRLAQKINQWDNKRLEVEIANLQTSFGEQLAPV